MRPDLVFANQEENVKAQVETLALHVPVWVSNVTDIASAMEMITATAALTNRIDAGRRLLGEIADNLHHVEAPPHPMTTLYAIWREPWIFAGGGTYIDSLLHTFGFHNLLAHQPRYPTLSLEAIRELKPETILLSSEPYPFKQKHIEELAALCPKAKIILTDGEMFGWYGSRLKQAVPYIADLRKKIGD